MVNEETNTMVETLSVSKSPKTLAPHQERVVAEKTALDKNIDLLSAFSDGKKVFLTLPEAERYRLVKQLKYMSLYSDILGERIEAF